MTVIIIAQDDIEQGTDMILQCADMIVTGEEVRLPGLCGDIADVDFRRAARVYGGEQIMDKQVGKNTGVKTAGTYYDCLRVQYGFDDGERQGIIRLQPNTVDLASHGRILLSLPRGLR